MVDTSMTKPDRDRDAAVACAGVTVRFGSFTAVDDVSVSFSPGEIHVIVGQNGAGKTTLARVIAGLQTRRSGTVRANGVDLADADRAQALAAGVEMVHQHSALIPELTVAETLEMNRPARRWVPYRRAAVQARWSTRLAERGLEVDVSRRVRDLSVELRQSVEIAATDPGPGGVLVLDEPTAVLPPQRVDALFDRLRRIRESGTTIIVVLHKLSEVRRIAGTVTVLRDGRLILDGAPIDSVDDTELANHIVGTAVPTAGQPTVGAGADTGPALILDGVGAGPARGDRAIEEVDLTLDPGSITGVAGVEGNGQRTLVEAIVGLLGVTTGRIRFGEDDWTGLDVGHRRRRGLRSVPFDRFDEGAAEELSLWMNLSAWDGGRHRRWPSLPLLSPQALRRSAGDRLATTSVAFQSLDQAAGSLSGGNLQRLILARELDGAEVMVAAQPTRGLDIGGMAMVWDALADLAGRAAPVLVVSSDLDELIERCHHIAVMRSGRIVATHHRPFDRAGIGRDMIGAEG
ncbi:MAG: ATP-binding cassette domain-containing protein [Actinomycetota bacterium]